VKYDIDLHTFSQKLIILMEKYKLINKKGRPDTIKLYNMLYPNDKITDELIKKDRQVVTDKTRKIDNWVKGKNYPKSISEIIALCNAFECDMDYFFTNMSCETHNKQFIHDYTGLSENAINKLKYYNRQMHNCIDALNILLVSANFENVLYRIKKYMKAVETTDGLSKIRGDQYEEPFSHPPDGENSSYNWPYNDSLDKMFTESLHEEELLEYNIDTYFRFVIKELARLAGRNI